MFTGVISRQILRYLNIHLEDWIPTEIFVIHVGVNDTIKDNSQSKVANFTRNIVKIIINTGSMASRKYFYSKSPVINFW